MAHVAFVCNPSDRIDPAARTSVAIVIANLAREVARAGHRVSLLAPDASKAATDPALSGIELVDIHAGRRIVARLDQFLSGYAGTRSPFATSRRCHALFRARIIATLGRLRPDIVHFSTYSQYLPEIARRLPGTRSVLHLHDELLGHVPAEQFAPRLRCASQVLCVNSHIRDTLLRRRLVDGSKLAVLHNAVDPGLFAVDAPPSHAHRLVYVGRISPEKGLHVLGAAVGRIFADFPGLVVDVVGPAGLIQFEWLRWIARDDAACRTLLPFYGNRPFDAFRRQVLDRGAAYVRDAIAAAGPARSAFRLHDFVPHAELQSFYRSAAAVVCPSVCNEIPLSAYEGMATGRPAVISGDALRDGPVVDGETALVVPRADPARLAGALAELLANPARAAMMGAAGRRTVLSHYAWRDAGRRLLAVYDRLRIERP